MTFFRKGFSITIVGLFFVISFTSLVSSIDNFDRNIEMVYRLNNNLSGYGTVCGFITDNQTGLPIENVKVDIQRNYKYWNHTFTNSSGFYNISVKSGAYIRIFPHADKYISKYRGHKQLEDNETIWINASMLPRPPENSNIFGYITDNDTGEPIEDVKIILGWRDKNWYRYTNKTYTNSSGFYNFNVAVGKLTLFLNAEGYYQEGWHGTIGENKTKQVNFSLFPVRPENSTVCGYITDSKTGEPIESAHVFLEWQDGWGHLLDYDNFTDSHGFYNMSVAKGIVSVRSITKKGYWSGCTSYFNIGENKTLWLNESLDPRAPEDALVYGYITDFETGEPLDNVGIRLDWKDRWGHTDRNQTITNNSGYYSMNVAEGKINILANKDGFYKQEKGWYDIDANEKKKVNFKLWPGIPSKPLIQGQKKGIPGTEYEYTFISWDDEKQVWYFIEWGDGINTSWLGPYNSGNKLIINHTWNETGEYTIRAKAKDIDNRESDWGKLSISMPKTKNMWYYKWLERFPRLQKILDGLRLNSR
jgi:5-hydroxyisourate hydrolase-like protein (transthyretin family)